jgi:hypothetical protein
MHRRLEDPVPQNPSPSPAEPSRRTEATAAAAEVNSDGRRLCFVSIIPPSSLLPLHAQVHQGHIPTPGSMQPRPQPPPRRAPMISATPHRRTSSTPPHRRKRAFGEIRDVLLSLPTQTASQIVHSSAQTAISGELPTKPPSGAAASRPFAAACRVRASSAADRKTNGPDQIGVYPLALVQHGPVDRGTRRGPQPC